MKKWLVFLLTTMVMAGSVFPCCMETSCEDDQTACSSQKENSHAKGTCSPFFACASCAGFVDVAKHPDLPQPIVQRAARFEKPSILLPSTYLSSFFQPPRNALPQA